MDASSTFATARRPSVTQSSPPSTRHWQDVHGAAVLATMGAQAEQDAPQPNGGVSIAAIGPLTDTRDQDDDAVVVNTLTYAYPGHKPLISTMSLRLPRGSRCLLIGANGAGASPDFCLVLRARACMHSKVCKHFQVHQLTWAALRRACRQDDAAAGASGQFHGGQGRRAHPGQAGVPRHHAGGVRRPVLPGRAMAARRGLCGL